MLLTINDGHNTTYWQNSRGDLYMTRGNWSNPLPTIAWQTTTEEAIERISGFLRRMEWQQRLLSSRKERQEREERDRRKGR